LHTDDALRAAAALNSQGIFQSRWTVWAKRNSHPMKRFDRAIYHELAGAISAAAHGRECELKLTQIGMDLDPRLAERIIREMTEHARETGSFVRVDMEGSEVYAGDDRHGARIHAEPGNRGTSAS